MTFLEDNVVLEGKLLDELAWEDIERHGPILILVTPWFLGKVINKKRSGWIALLLRLS